jgi:hypothetical protein
MSSLYIHDTQLSLCFVSVSCRCRYLLSLALALHHFPSLTSVPFLSITTTPLDRIAQVFCYMKCGSRDLFLIYLLLFNRSHIAHCLCLCLLVVPYSVKNYVETRLWASERDSAISGWSRQWLIDGTVTKLRNKRNRLTSPNHLSINDCPSLKKIKKFCESTLESTRKIWESLGLTRLLTRKIWESLAWLDSWLAKFESHFLDSDSQVRHLTLTLTLTRKSQESRQL